MTNFQTQSQNCDMVEKNKKRSVIKPALSEKTMEQILNSANVKRAWQQVKRNHGAPGVDGMTIEEFPTYARKHWSSIHSNLNEEKYQPLPVRRVEIPKPSGGKRPLGIPTVIDRVIQQAIAQILTPIFDPEFSESSFGFRPNRSAHDGVRKVRQYINEGYIIAVKVDLQKFFDEVNHDVLMNRVAKKVKDKAILKLIGKYLRAGVLANGVVEPTKKGVPQGGPLSPLLSNIVLDDLDKELENRGHRFVRYADDFVIMVKSTRAGERVKKSIVKFLEKKLKLKVNSEKSNVDRAKALEFLGFTFPGKTIRWTHSAFLDFKKRIRAITGRSTGVSMEHRIAELSRYIRGWMSYFGISQYYSPIAEIDQWIRRRIRMCYWKQWRYAKTKVTALLKLGTNLKTAIACAMSRKGFWHMSRTLATQTGMTNIWFSQTLGLVSVRDLWIQLHYPS